VNHPRTSHDGPEGEYRNSSSLSLTSALDADGGQHHAPAALSGNHCTVGPVWKGAENPAPPPLSSNPDLIPRLSSL
jgi:hypothetical protein